MASLVSASWRPYEHYASSHQKQRDSEDDNVWHRALRFLRSKRLRVYSPRQCETRELPRGRDEPSNRFKRSSTTWCIRAMVEVRIGVWV